jgi:hypothetical protein
MFRALWRPLSQHFSTVSQAPLQKGSRSKSTIGPPWQCRTEASRSVWSSCPYAKSFEQAPTVNAGFYSRSDATLNIYLCAPVYVCKGGVHGSEGCAGDRRNFMCSECPYDYVLSTGDLEDDPSASDCRKCGAVNWLFLILLPLIGLVALLAVLADAKRSPLDNSGG